jgi:hypothetical protein
VKALGKSRAEGNGRGARKRACVEEEEDEPFMAERFWPNDRIRNISGQSARS